MANSSKKISKVVAIAMASAMAMSSLSAALVSVSAASENQISTTGSLDFELTGLDYSDVNKEYQVNLIQADSDLSANATALPTWDEIKDSVEYEDEDGRIVKGSDMSDVSLTYSVSSGSSVKLNDDKTGYYAVNGKKGTTTIKATVKGKVTLNSDDKTKTVTASKNIVIDVKEAGERTLEVWDAQTTAVDNDTDVKDLAAVGGKAQVSVVEWTGTAGEKATASLLKDSFVGTPDGTETIKVADLVTALATELQLNEDEKGKLETALKKADTDTDDALLQTEIDAIDLSKEEIKQNPSTKGYLLTVLEKANVTNAKKAYTQATWTALIQKVTVDTANKTTSDLTGKADGTNLFKITGSEDIYGGDNVSLAGENAKAYTKGATKYINVGSGDTPADGGQLGQALDQAGATSAQYKKVYVYTANTLPAITDQNILSDQTYTTGEYDAKLTEALKAVGGEKGKAQGVDKYYVTDKAKAEALKTTNVELAQFVTAVEGSESDIDGTWIDFTAQAKAKANELIKAAVPGTGTIEYTVSSKSVLEDVAGEETFEKSGKFQTKGNVGSATITAKVTEGKTSKSYKMTIATVKAIELSEDATIQKQSSGKVWAETGKVTDAKDAKNISGYDIRANGKKVTVDSGSIGDIVDATDVVVNGGNVGDILDATTTVEVTDGKVGTIDSANATVTVSEGTIAAIINAKSVTMNGGNVTGDVIGQSITLDAKSDDDGGAIVIGGNVTGKPDFAGSASSAAAAKVTIDSTDDAGSTITIRGNVASKFADDNTLSGTDAVVSIGSEDTVAKIAITGNVQGDLLSLGGKGKVSFAALKNSGEKLYDVDEKVSATVKFNHFNGTVADVADFDYVIVENGTAGVTAASTLEDLTVQSDATAVFAGGLTVNNIIGDGTLEIPAGKLTIDGDVNDSPTLQATGSIGVGTTVYVAGRGMENVFNTPGLEMKSSSNPNGGFNYVVNKAELQGLYASATTKEFDIAVGSSQTVEVAVNPSNVALPEGYSIKWEAPEGAYASVVGNGTSATITANEWSDIEDDSDNTVEITATIVDANGNDAGYDSVTFTANIVDKVVPPVVLDTTSKNLQVGESYSFLVRDNKDAANIQLVYDANIVDVKLANADYNGRGVLYTVTAKANGSTDVNVTYQGQTATMKVKVGGFQLDTSAKTMNVGTTYSFLAKNVKAEEAGNVQFTYDNTVAKVELAQADYNGRGALFTVTALKTGSTDIKATYNNEEATMKLDVVEYTGKMTLDTASYTMPLGGTYTIGVKIEKNGKQLTGAEVNAMIASGELVVRDSRTGTIINKPEVLANGNVRVTGKNTEGTTYVMFEIVKDGKVATHASIGVTVKAGATAGGSSRRSVSQW